MVKNWQALFEPSAKTPFRQPRIFPNPATTIAEEAKPRTQAEIVELLRTDGENFASWLETLTPEFLVVGITEADGKTVKSRFERLLGAKEHEMHHRAQLMLIERQLGIVPHITRQMNERLAQMRAAKA